MLSWGRNDHGQLGHGDLENRGTPEILKFFEGSKIKRVSAGWNHSAFVTGFSSHNLKLQFVIVFLLFDTDSLLYFLLITTLDMGCLFTCGDGSFGQLGNGDIQSFNVPSEVPFFSSKHVEVEEIACGIRHTLALVNGKNSSIFQVEP